MPNTAKKMPFYTADEYFQLTEETNQHTELIGGEIIAQAAPSLLHQSIAGGLHAELLQFVRRNGGSCKPFIAPADVKLSEETVVQPDVFVVCNPNRLTAQYVDGAPDFVAEIVSENRSDDYDRKLWLYRISGVREYWIIDPKAKRTLVYFFEERAFPEMFDFDRPIPVRIWDGNLSVTISDLT